MLSTAWRQSKSWWGRITAATAMASSSSDDAQVPYAKQVNAFLGTDVRGSNILCPFQCFDELEPTALLLHGSNGWLLLCSGASDATAADLAAATSSSTLFMSLMWQSKMNYRSAPGLMCLIIAALLVQ